jgi:transposase-like protein
MRKRWTVADAQAVVDRMAVSGLSVREFAEAEGLETQRIYRWRSLLGEKRRPAFVEVNDRR